MNFNGVEHSYTESYELDDWRGEHPLKLLMIRYAQKNTYL